MNERSPNKTALLGRTTFRNEGKPFGIREQDRLHSMHVIGRTGTGKSTLLDNMMLQDLRNNTGFALLDPHGDLAESLAARVPEHRRDSVIYFDVPDRSSDLGFNPLIGIPARKRTLASSGILETFKKLWPEFWGPRTEHILRNAVLAIVEQPEPSLADVLRLFDDATFRKRMVGRITNDQVRRFWKLEFEGYTARLRAEAIAPIQNKIGGFLTDPLLKRALTARTSSFDLRGVMDQGQVLLVNLSKGQLGEDTSSLLGSLLVSQIGLAAMSRADLPTDQRRPFFVYADEFQSFATISFAGMLSELRKFGVGFILAHQFLAQVDDRVRQAVLGNVGSMVIFRVGVEDADVIERELWPEVRARDLVGLPNFNVYIKMMVDGVVTRPFSAATVGPGAREGPDQHF